MVDLRLILTSIIFKSCIGNRKIDLRDYFQLAHESTVSNMVLAD